MYKNEKQIQIQNMILNFQANMFSSIKHDILKNFFGVLLLLIHFSIQVLSMNGEVGLLAQLLVVLEPELGQELVLDLINAKETQQNRILALTIQPVTVSSLISKNIQKYFLAETARLLKLRSKQVKRNANSFKQV